MRPLGDLQGEIAALAGFELDGLRLAWAARFGPAPRLRSVELLRLMLAWRLQAAALGGFDRDTRRGLRGRRTAPRDGRHLGLGAILRRDWQGRSIEVVVEAGGFCWEDRLYPSLSAVARAATGTRWNGPRFFGLREKRA